MAVSGFGPRTGSWIAVMLGATLLSACGSSGVSYNGPNGSFQSGPNVYNSGALPPSNLGFAGTYDAFRSVSVAGSTITEHDYLYISASGVISTFVYQGDGTVSPARNCYLPATGSEPNAGLQGAQLTETTTTSGTVYYHVVVHGYDIGFGTPSNGGSPDIYINGNLQTGTTGATLYVGNQGDTFMLGGQPDTNITLATLNLCS